MGVKALVYFEVVRRLHCLLACSRRQLSKPGTGVPLVTEGASETVQKIGEAHPQTLTETLVHVFPSSVVDSLVRGDILQIVAFAVLFAMAVSAVGEKGKPLLRGTESLSQVMFKLDELRHEIRADWCRRGHGAYNRHRRSGCASLVWET